MRKYFINIEMNKTIIVTFITFSIFSIEAMLHYNIGINKGNSLKDYKIQIPPWRDIFLILCVVFCVSFINGIIINRFT